MVKEGKAMNIVEVENVSKKYVISQKNPYASLRETLSNFGRDIKNRLLSKEKVSSQDNNEEFWALKNINLEIKEGDRVALLGRNGAGKSTFLKLLSRITAPTKGVIRIRGRVSSLLEVGTGFHPDLTGRENILFSGAIMGMSYQEMRKKFDEIVHFADIEKFLDTPIKRYSSGMFMRLGFAIAAHLHSDLLIVDEVLAVGDYQFQEKCLKRMNEIGSQGSTILFVSHSTNSVLSLCNKGILLDQGEIKAFEPIEQCVSKYIRSCPVAGMEWIGNVGDDHIRVYKASLKAPKNDTGFFYQSDETTLGIDCEIIKPRQDLILGFSVINSRNNIIAKSRLCDKEENDRIVSHAKKHHLSFHLDLNLFHPGEYQVRLDCSLLNRKKILHDEVLLKFAIYSQPSKANKFEIGAEKDGISLGNRWNILA